MSYELHGPSHDLERGVRGRVQAGICLKVRCPHLNLDHTQLCAAFPTLQLSPRDIAIYLLLVFPDRILLCRDTWSWRPQCASVSTRLTRLSSGAARWITGKGARSPFYASSVAQKTVFLHVFMFIKSFHISTSTTPEIWTISKVDMLISRVDYTYMTSSCKLHPQPACCH